MLGKTHWSYSLLYSHKPCSKHHCIFSFTHRLTPFGGKWGMYFFVIVGQKRNVSADIVGWTNDIQWTKIQFWGSNKFQPAFAPPSFFRPGQLGRTMPRVVNFTIWPGTQLVVTTDSIKVTHEGSVEWICQRDKAHQMKTQLFGINYQDNSVIAACHCSRNYSPRPDVSPANNASLLLDPTTAKETPSTPRHVWPHNK